MLSLYGPKSSYLHIAEAAVFSGITTVSRRSLTEPMWPPQVPDEWYAQLQPWTDHAECRCREVQQRPQRDEGETYLLW